MTTNGDLVTALRLARSKGEQPKAVGADLRDANLWGVNLWGADLRTADLRGADLRGADLRDADLRGAALRGADLRGAALWGANLRDADLWDANLRDADLRGIEGPGVLRVDGLPSHQVTLIPAVGGWVLHVGCWTGTPDELRALIATDDDWPEATGEEVTRRRPLLEALLVLIDAHIAARPDLIDDLTKKWGNA